MTLAAAEKRVRYSHESYAEAWDAFLVFFASAVRRASRIEGVSNKHRSEQHCKQRERNARCLLLCIFQE